METIKFSLEQMENLYMADALSGTGLKKYISLLRLKINDLENQLGSLTNTIECICGSDMKIEKGKPPTCVNEDCPLNKE